MKELVEVIAKALVDNPDEVVVTENRRRKECNRSNFMLLLPIWARSLENREELQKQSALWSRQPL